MQLHHYALQCDIKDYIKEREFKYFRKKTFKINYL